VKVLQPRVPLQRVADGEPNSLLTLFSLAGSPTFRLEEYASLEQHSAAPSTVIRSQDDKLSPLACRTNSASPPRDAPSYMRLQQLRFRLASHRDHSAHTVALDLAVFRILPFFLRTIASRVLQLLSSLSVNNSHSVSRLSTNDTLHPCASNVSSASAGCLDRGIGYLTVRGAFSLPSSSSLSLIQSSLPHRFAFSSFSTPFRPPSTRSTALTAHRHLTLLSPLNMHFPLTLLGTTALLSTLASAAPLPASSCNNDVNVDVGVGVNIGGGVKVKQGGQGHCPGGWTPSLLQVNLCIEIDGDDHKEEQKVRFFPAFHSFLPS
jgi:hypothetical protein